jgi:hypothetical protein
MTDKKTLKLSDLRQVGPDLKLIFTPTNIAYPCLQALSWQWEK